MANSDSIQRIKSVIVQLKQTDMISEVGIDKNGEEKIDSPNAQKVVEVMEKQKEIDKYIVANNHNIERLDNQIQKGCN